ncbi:LytR/AlgR family response regulator transcription factor [Pseudoalteromonas denitrificans]|jgi:two-component system LytT family response regulator|uniref:Two component transcriptional regulator, LytTR family n=1 Tax=Pseudoalteromonas denitrificans DSM 6059 TaxID=1123010 RepID=A0A1I1JAU2_9GAMM|nr:LytTR family DNA-binding domain-containing protein [Pseudoalteromonas denitrificans]SFC45231.1 two component transcriptional regulator, LytTR family [Pseudoalteromonas denitrificans DSM 6059]
MKKFNVVIASASEKTRSNIKQLLEFHFHFDFETVALITNECDVLSACTSGTVDVLFIDSNLLSDFDQNQIIEKLSSEIRIVYLSKDSIQAADAFDLGVIDYLIYPFGIERFHKCIKKLLKELNSIVDFPMQYMQKMLRQFQVPIEKKDPIIVKGTGNIRIIDTDDILWVASAGNYVELHLSDEQRPILHRETLTSMLNKLTSHGFIQVHRSALVKKRSISELKPTDNGDYLITLKNGALLNLSRRYKQSMAGILN